MEHEGQLAFDFEEFEREKARARLDECAVALHHGLLPARSYWLLSELTEQNC